MSTDLVEVTPYTLLVGNQCGVPNCSRPVTFPHITLVFDKSPWTFLMNHEKRSVMTRFCNPHRDQWARGDLALPFIPIEKSTPSKTKGV